MNNLVVWNIWMRFQVILNQENIYRKRVDKVMRNKNVSSTWETSWETQI